MGSKKGDTKKNHPQHPDQLPEPWATVLFFIVLGVIVVVPLVAYYLSYM